MVAISIIQRSNLQGRRRIDAEYYRPAFIRLDDILSSKQPLPIYAIAKTLRSFGAYSLMNQVFYQESGIPFLRCIDIEEGYADFSNVIFIDENSHRLLWKSEVTAGQVLLAMSGSVGNAAVARPTWNYPVNSSQDLAKITLKEEYDPYYVATFLNSKYGRFQTERLPVGSVQQHVFLWQISSIKIPYYERLSQKVSRVNDNAIQQLESSLSFYSQADRLLLSELGLTDWKPTRHLTFVRDYSQVSAARRIDAEHFHPKYSELRDHIRNYRHGYQKITDIARNSGEIADPRAHPETAYRYIELADINQAIGTIESSNDIKGKDAPSRARMVLRTGDVIASTVEGSLDKVALVSQDYDGAIGSTGFFVLRPRTVASGYLLSLTKSIVVREQMRCESSGTILAAIPAKSLGNVIVPNIPSDKRDEIASLVQQSHQARREAKALLKKAKRAVEIAIEEGEDKAIDYID